MGHKEVKTRRIGCLFVLGFSEDELPTCQTHQLPKEQKTQCIGCYDHTDHRSDEGKVVQQIMGFSLDVRQISLRIEKVGYGPQHDQCGKYHRKGVKLKHVSAAPNSKKVKWVRWNDHRT